MTRLAVIVALGASLGAALVAAGCAADCPVPAAGAVEVGVGDLDTGFIEVGDGDDVQVVLGPQGLHMIVVAARLADDGALADGEAARVSVGIRHGEQIVGGTVQDVPVADGALLGLRAVFTVAEVAPLAGELVRVEIEVDHGCGASAGHRAMRLVM